MTRIRLALAIAAGSVLLVGGCDHEPGGPPEDASACQKVASSLAGTPAPPAPGLLETRRRALARTIQQGVVVLAASVPDPDPQNNGYRGDNSLYYLAGFEVPGSWLLISVSGGQVDSTLLYVPESSTSPSAPVSLRALTGVDAVRCTADFHQDLEGVFPAGAAGTLYLNYRNPAAADSLVDAVRTRPEVESRELYALLGALRAVKDTAEINRLRRAAEITAGSVRAAVGSIYGGRNEQDVASAVLSGFLSRGAAGASFPSIIASGPNALTLHYNENRRQLQGTELILLDVGAEYGRYAGDVTRTFPVSGHFSERQRQLYELVLGAQQAAIDAVRPGISMSSLEAISRAYLRTYSGSLCGSKSCEEYFKHLLSHSLGLNVHDAGLSYDAPLQPGMVITVEPGIYLASDSIGIRIEDDVLVTGEGHEVLSSGAPRSVQEIETLFAARASTFAALALREHAP